MKLHLLPQIEILESFLPKSQALVTDLSFGLRYYHGFNSASSQAPHSSTRKVIQEALGKAKALQQVRNYILIDACVYETLSVVEPTFVFLEKASTSQTRVQSSEGEIGSQNQAHDCTASDVGIPPYNHGCLLHTLNIILSLNVLIISVGG